MNPYRHSWDLLGIIPVLDNLELSRWLPGSAELLHLLKWRVTCVAVTHDDGTISYVDHRDPTEDWFAYLPPPA